MSNNTEQGNFFYNSDELKSKEESTLSTQNKFSGEDPTRKTETAKEKRAKENGPKRSRKDYFKQDFDGRYELAKTFPQMYEGTDGKFYVKNPFNNDHCSYAQYANKDQYDNGKVLPLKHVDHDFALKFFEVEEYFLFTLNVNGREVKHETNLAGDCVNRTRS